jgi:hypothetical protein
MPTRELRVTTYEQPDDAGGEKGKTVVPDPPPPKPPKGF